MNWFHIAQDYGDRNVELSEPPLQDFDFIDCRFTVSESPSSDPDDLPTTTLLHINRPRDFFLSLPSVDVAQRPNLLLRRTLVRGDCHLIRSTPATPFYLMWEQSLFVSQQVAIQLGGVAQVESGEDPLVALNASRLELRSVTSTSPGVVEVRVTSSDPEPPQFSLDARRCWFSLADGEAVVHHRLLTQVANDEDLFTLSGQENLYASSTLLWQLDIAGQVDRFVPLQDASFAANWYQQRLNESHPSMPTVWRQFLSGRMPRAEVTVDDLRSAIQEVELSGVRRMGVDPNELATLDSMSEGDSRSEPEPEF